MSKTLINFILDGVLGVALLLALWTSAVLHFVFPPGPESAGWSLAGMDYQAWARIQFVSLFVFAILVLIHVMLHWSWVCGVAAQRLNKSLKLQQKIVLDESTQTIVGVAALVGLLHVLGIMFLAALLSIVPPSETSAKQAPVSSSTSR